MSDAAARAAARRAKIQARGNAGLQKLAQTARGDEAEMLYGESSAEPSRTATPVATNTTAPPASASTSAAGNTGSRPNPAWTPPADQQQMAAQLEAMMSMFGGGAGGGGPGAGAPDMSALLNMLGAGPGGGVQNLLGDLDDPAGLNPPFGGMPDLSSLGSLSSLGNLGGGGGGGGSAGPGGLFGSGPAPRTRAERALPLIHVAAVLALVGAVVVWWEPALRHAAGLGALGLGTWDRWASLSGRRALGGTLAADLGGLQPLPLFWAFITLELLLTTSRALLGSSSRPPALLATFLPLLPPALGRRLRTGARYLSLAAQVYRDGCVLVWAVGVVVLVAEYVR
ncbi:hypothetical protein Q5752_002645 [Cryptotrichosporon argae]